MRAMRLGLLVLAVVVCLGSGASKTAYRAETTEAPAGVEDEDLYAAAVRVLGDEGYSIREKDKDAGIVVTEWITVDRPEIGDSTLVHAWRVVISEGEFRISIDCEWVHKGTRTTCHNTDRVDSFAGKEPGLRDAILREAKRRAAKRMGMQGATGSGMDD